MSFTFKTIRYFTSAGRMTFKCHWNLGSVGEHLKPCGGELAFLECKFHEYSRPSEAGSSGLSLLSLCIFLCRINDEKEKAAD
jgi:hypothetical protein